MRRLLLVCTAAVMLAGGVGVPARADSDPTYPITSFTDWTGTARKDATDQSIGQYQFDAAMVGGVNRAAARYPKHYDPRRFLDPDGGFARLAEEAQTGIDSVARERPDPPYDHAFQDAGSPAFMPDFSGDGRFGDPADFDHDTDDVLDTAPFLYPCPNEDGTVSYETTTGACVPGGQRGVRYKLGLARELKIVDSRGFIIDATLWLPGDALKHKHRYPGVVFSDGFASRQDNYYWFAMLMARAGYVVLTYDPPGQGESQGTGGDLFDTRDDCDIGGACRDLQDMVRWFDGDAITPVPRQTTRLTPPHNPGYAPAGENRRNPVLRLLDRSKISIAGNSMGAISVVNYVHYLAMGHGADGKPLPGLASAISLSGASQTAAIVPFQFQTSDYDGSPALLTPGVAGIALGAAGNGIGYSNVKQGYDALEASKKGTAPIQLAVLEGGTHLDHVDIPYMTRTVWALSVAGSLARDWLDCYVKGERAACERSVRPRPHLSRAFATEQDSDGPAGASPSRCITVPDRANLNQSPGDFVQAEAGRPVYTCKP